jgi:hypothetical protein
MSLSTSSIVIAFARSLAEGHQKPSSTNPTISNTKAQQIAIFTRGLLKFSISNIGSY